MTTTLGELVNNGVILYVDDIINYRKNFEEHNRFLEEVLQRLQKAGLFINIKSSVLAKSKLTYLGVIISETGVESDPNKIEASSKRKEHIDRTEGKRFLGLPGSMR